MIYLVHFAEPFHHAKHYLGFVDTAGRDPVRSLETRLDYHRKGKGSKLLRAVAAAGIEFEVVRTWPEGDRNMERRLKGHSSTRLCPTCNPEKCWGRARMPMDDQVRQEIEQIISGSLTP